MDTVNATGRHYDRQSTLRRGAAIVMFLLAFALLGPGVFGLVWDAGTPNKADNWLLVALAVVYAALGAALMVRRIHTRRLTREQARLAIALAVSLFIHALIMSLRFGLAGMGLPDFASLFAERRAKPVELTVQLAEAPRPPPVDLRVSKELISAPPTVRLAEPPRKPREQKPKAKPRPRILAQTQPQPDTFKVPPPKRVEPPPQRPPEVVAEKKPVEEPPPVAPPPDDTAQKEAEELARQRALALQKEQEKKLEEARKVEEERKLAELKLQEEKQKQEEEAKRLTLEAEALKRAEEAARQQALARQKELEAKRLAEEAAARAKEAADRQRAEAEAAAKREKERLAAKPAPGVATGPASGPAPGALSGAELAQRAIEQIRKPEAPRADTRPGPGLPPPAIAETPRRRAIFGTERDVVLRMYVESWRSKVERNGAMNYKAEASRKAHRNPVATVSIRSDGTLEYVSINQSSGVRELDEAVLHIARLYAPYSAFPPALARQYDVIEIQREWFFDSTLRLLDVTARN